MRTRDTSRPLTTADKWLNGQPADKEASSIDLKPADMEPRESLLSFVPLGHVRLLEARKS